MKGVRCLPHLLVIIVFGAAVPHPRADEPRQPDDAKLILDKALKALGGEEKISKLHAVCVKGTCLRDGVKKGSFEATFAAVDKIRFEGHIQDGPNSRRVIAVISGENCWGKIGDGETIELDTKQSEVTPDFLHALCLPDLLMTLKGNGYSLGNIAEEKVESRESVVLRVCHKNKEEVHLYFDKSSALPIKSKVKIHRETPDGTQNEISEEFFFSNYKEFGGVKHFTHVRVHTENGDVEFNLKEVDLREKLDPAVFEKP
jgi:hypothetical protein